MAEDKLKVTFYGGVENPTGSNFLIERGSIRILIDCGLFQGCRICEDKNHEAFSYDPRSIDYLFVTHAHLDHIGRIPKLVREGFKGRIISTHPTKDISELMLMDSLRVFSKEAKILKKPVIYNEDDVRKALSLWKGIDYKKVIDVDEFQIKFTDAGHILGSSLIHLNLGDKKLVFTGDLGNSPTPLLRETEDIKDVDYLFMESVYGDRNHEDLADRKRILEDVIEDAVKRGGTLMIPAFSLERTQVLLYEINYLVERGKIPKVPIFIDSPLAINVTKIYKKYESLFNYKVQDEIRKGDDIFNFPGVKFTYTSEESMAIKDVSSPKIIIAGSGMSNGGRIVHHEKIYLSDPKSTLLIVGYQAPGSMGRIIQDGAKRVEILGQEDIPVRAKVVNIRGYSAHKDSNNLIEFVSRSADSLKHVYVIMGEPKSSLFLVQRIRDYLGISASAPKLGDSVIIRL